MSGPSLRFLHDLGFALHWLRPRSKVPVRAGWTTGERLSFSDFEADGSPNYNVGVRLGDASKLSDGTYLGVIDVDIKESTPKTRQEAYEKLYELFPQADSAPCVESGRGGGSAHFYIRMAEPTRGADTKAKSRELSQVHMPSVEANKTEKEKLTQAQVDAGIRIRPSWEISLLSSGRQVVLPKSVHPDSGKRYRWVRTPNGVSSFPLVLTIPGAVASSPSSSAASKGETAKSDYRFTTVDLEGLSLSREQLAQITEGEGVTDRSATAFSIAMALLQRGVTDEQVISILTDRDRFWLGQVGFDHAKTTNRQRAAVWIDKYCLRKAKEKVAESKIAPDVFELKGDWTKDLDLQPGPKGTAPAVRPTFKNVLLILENEVGFDFLSRNTFANEDLFTQDTPWGAYEGKKRSGNVDDALAVKEWLIGEYRVECSTQMIDEVLNRVAAKNCFHPVQDFLESLEWDGVPRIETALEVYCGARMPKAYIRQVSRLFFQALVARIYDPGCKFDHMVVFEGIQGRGKSSFGYNLVGEEWFMDGLPNLSDKDAALNLQGIWLCEMAELSSLQHSQLESAKAFISRRNDKVRPPYGHRRVDLKRASVFYGTTNNRDYLKDVTGNRRFWPVEFEQLNFKKLAKDRLQLLAEAKFDFDFDRQDLYLKGKASDQSVKIQSLRVVEGGGDEMARVFRNWLKLSPADRGVKDVSSLVMGELFESGPFAKFDKGMSAWFSAGHVLRDCGYEKAHTENGKRWIRKK